LLTGCGYTLVGHETPCAKVNLKGKKVAVRLFKNETKEPDIEYTISHYISSELIRDGRVKIVNSEEAEYIIEGEVTKYSKKTLALDPQGITRQYKLIIGVNVVIKSKDGNELWEMEDLTEDAEFETTKEVETSKALEREALKKAAKDLAQMLTGLLL